ncbi:hypothetical protein L6164_005343 [Bauhinia variegata]|uniref:Uncharacterized protein n=1 Tax=Bauhinia variegata TaxID=167791 RepID=A0ACB9PTK6_BAUVA|nr:hypothetical protein L6164_005343 [Bauhinia variegata]
MDIHFPMFLSIITICSFLLTSLPPSYGREYESYRPCNTTYNCGSLINISYPFWGENRPRYCGSSDMLELSCDQNHSTTIQVGSETFTVMWIDQSTHTMRMVRRNLVPSSCPSNFTITLNPALFFHRPQTVENMTLFYSCDPQFSNSLPTEIKSNNFTCLNESGREEQGFYVHENELQKYGEGLTECDVKVQVPVSRNVALGNEGGNEALNTALAHELDMQYTLELGCPGCYGSGGMCGRKSNSSQFSCYCRDGVQDLTCPDYGKHISVRNKVIIGITGGITGATLICIAICCSRCKVALWL